MLDIGNVIVDVNFSVFCDQVAERSGDEADIYDKFCIGSFKEDFDSGRVSISGFLKTLRGDPLVRNISVKEIRNAWQDIFSLTPGCSEGINLLKKRYRVWIMSDTDPLHFTFLLNTFPVLHAMERYYVSYEHGFLKNSPEAFRHVLQTSAIGAAELLLIDDKAENCEACRSEGIGSIRFTGWNDIIERFEM